MPLTAITIENFKAFSQPVTIPLRPITLLFGPNSAGKSTIIQALQYAWEILENRNPDVDRTGSGGEAIDLGGFRSLVHKHDLTKSISITMHFKGGLNHGAYISPEVYYSSVLEKDFVAGEGPVDVTEWLDVDELAVRVTSAWDMAANRPFISAYEVSFDGVLFGRIEGNPGHRPNLMINADHPFLSEEAMDKYDERGETFMRALLEHFATPFEIAMRLVNRMTDAERHEVLEHLNQQLNSEANDSEKSETRDAKSAPPQIWVDDVIPEWGRILSVSKIVGRDTGVFYTIEDEVLWVLSQLLLGAGESVLQVLRGLRYVGPLRAIPDRNHLAPLQPQQSRWANGLGAWDALLRAEPEEGIVQKCSDYLANVLKLGYTLHKKERLQLDADDKVFSELRLIASNYDEYEGEDLQQRTLKRLDSLPRVSILQLHDEKNDIDVAPMDIGVGVSQVIPVVVGAVEPNCSIFAVEQPELHVHPAVQSRLGDVFIRESLSGKSNRIFLLETHSEHLILRILRRIRETSEDELPPDFPPIRPTDVHVIYVEPSPEGATLHTLAITDDGDFEDAWPNGFFTEREEDLF